MNIDKVRLSVHNNYKAKIYSKDGVLKQSGYAENAVLNRFWDSAATSRGFTLFKFLSVGTGSPEDGGDVSPENKAMYNRIGGFIAYDEHSITVENEDNKKTVRKKMKFVVPATQEYSGKLTEVAIFGSEGLGTMNSHALFKDSEGNNISIDKQDSDTMIIEVNIYVVVNYSSGISPNKELDVLSFRILHESGETNNGFLYTPLEIFLSPIDDSLISSENGISSSFYRIGLESKNSRSDVDVKKREVIFKTTRSPDSSDNSGFANYLNIKGLGSIRLPDNSHFREYEVNHEVGVGDGETKEFKFPFPEFKEGSETITINGIPLQRDIDYSLSNNNNSLMHTSSFESHKEEMVHLYTSSGSLGRSPFLYGGGYNTDIITIEYKNEITVEGFFAQRENFGSRASVDLLYSDDGEEYKLAVNISDKGPNWTSLEEPITAKFWRISGSPGYASRADSDRAVFAFGKTPSNLVFKEAPADKAKIEVSCTLNRPFKSNQYIFDASYKLKY